MRKILWPLALISVVALAASTFTTNYNLEKPADGDTTWGSAYRDAMDTIDTQMSVNATDISDHLSDTTAAHAASAISTVAATLCSDTDGQSFLECLDAATYAIQQNYVTTNTTQEITGSKTFTSLTVANGGLTVNGALTFPDVSDGVCHISSGVISGSSIVNADVDAAAAIAYSKLALTGAITSSDLTDGTIVNADVNASAAIAYSKLALTGAITSSDLTDGTIVNADVNASAAIARTKLASGTASHVLINDGSGVMSSEAQLALTRGGTGINAASTTALFNGLDPLTTKGDLVTHNGTDSIRLPVGTDGHVLVADSTQSAGIKWAASGAGGGVSIGGTVTSGTAGSVLFVDGSGNLGQNNAAFNWNDTTKKLSLTNATATDGTMLTVTATDTSAAVSAHGGIQSVYTASNAASTLPAAIYASSTAGVASAPAIGIYSQVSAGGQTGVDGSGIYVAQSSSNYNTYSGIYVEGPSTGTVAFDNYSLNVSTGNSFFGGELAVVTTKSGGTSTGALRSVITQTGTPNTVGAMYAESSTGANNTQVIGLVSKVLNTGGYTGNNGFGIAIPAQSGDWSNYYGLYISGASSGTVTTNNRALHVNSGASYFGGSIIANTLTASEAVATDANKNLVSVAGVSATELGYLSAVTSDIQTQLDGKQATGNYITALTGDVTASGPGSVAATIANSAVTNAKMADMATQTFKGRTTAGTGVPEDLTATQATAILNAMVGDSGAGGTKGLVPAPSSGDAAANKFLKADGTWSSVGIVTTATENISASGSIASSTVVTYQYRRIQGNSAAVTASSTPFGAGGGWVDGTLIRLVGQSSTNTVTITHNDAAKGAILNGDCTLGQYDTLDLQYDSTADRWIETARSIK